MRQVMLIINPSAGNEKAQDYQGKLQDKLKTYFDCVDLRETKGTGDATALAKEAAKKHYHSVFVMGGDGTVNEGINGLANEQYRPYFGFIPLGTVNDLARALGLSLDPKRAIEQLDFERRRLLDIGKIGSAYFMNVVAIGHIPQAINDVSAEDKTRLGRSAYFISGFKQLLHNKPYHFHVSGDGNLKQLTSSTLIIGLTNSVGGFEHFLPKAKVDDGCLHLIYLKDTKPLMALAAIPSLLSGTSQSDLSLGYEQFQEIEIGLEEGHLLTNVDGDPGPALPVKISVLPSHLEVYY